MRYMSYLSIIIPVLSHIVASLYMQKTRYNKPTTACFWGIYAIISLLVMIYIKSVVVGFFIMLFLQAIIFYIASMGSVSEKIFLLLTYSNSFCICIGINLFLSSFFGDNMQSKIFSVISVIIMQLFLYKFLIPIYKKTRIFLSSGWWKFNIVLVFFLIQFLNQYAFNIINKSSAGDLILDFTIHSIIFYSTLFLIFDSVKDVAEMNKKSYENDILKDIAYTDALTHMKNRAAYMKFTRKQMIRYRKNKNLDIMLVIMDIDGFKNINDKNGHIAGDKILKQVADVITKHCELINCKSFRFGGDEFVLLLENKKISDVNDLANKINEELRVTNNITLTYGLQKVDFSYEKPFDVAFEKADLVMYSKKHHNQTN